MFNKSYMILDDFLMDASKRLETLLKNGYSVCLRIWLSLLLLLLLLFVIVYRAMLLNILMMNVYETGEYRKGCG